MGRWVAVGRRRGEANVTALLIEADSRKEANHLLKNSTTGMTTILVMAKVVQTLSWKDYIATGRETRKSNEIES